MTQDKATTGPHFDKFISLANAGDYREALLALEQVWLVERSEFYAGVLQLLVALNQIRIGLTPTRTLQRARERISPYAPYHARLDVTYLLAVIAECEQLLSEEQPVTSLPRLQLEVMDE